ncbi:hypothetical protein AAY473_040168 [Plecturocebus cupreus]
MSHLTRLLVCIIENHHPHRGDYLEWVTTWGLDSEICLPPPSFCDLVGGMVQAKLIAERNEGSSPTPGHLRGLQQPPCPPPTHTNTLTSGGCCMSWLPKGEGDIGIIAKEACSD